MKTVLFMVGAISLFIFSMWLISLFIFVLGDSNYPGLIASTPKWIFAFSPLVFFYKDKKVKNFLSNPLTFPYSIITLKMINWFTKKGFIVDLDGDNKRVIFKKM